MEFIASSDPLPPPHPPERGGGQRRLRWSWSIGHVGGIDGRVHAGFALLVGLAGVGPLTVGEPPSVAFTTVALVFATFAIIVMHELGHALVAAHFGFRTREIVLLPIGGVAELDEIPTEPTQELLVALAGPAVNVGLAAMLLLLRVRLGGRRCGAASGAPGRSARRSSGRRLGADGLRDARADDDDGRGRPSGAPLVAGVVPGCARGPARRSGGDGELLARLDSRSGLVREVTIPRRRA